MSTIGPISFSMTVPQHDDDAVHEAPMRFLEGTGGSPRSQVDRGRQNRLYLEMESSVDDSFLKTPAWEKLRKRW